MRQRLAGHENPGLLQWSPALGGTSSSPPPLPAAPPPQSLPLFLVHDGGGTTFSYACLDPLGGRTVLGIHNERFDEGGFWEGGIGEMARRYVEMVEEVVGDEGGDVLLGGWSLGGSLSLEMAHQIARSPSKLRVVGMLWVDTVFPHHVPGETSSSATAGPNERITEGTSEAQISAMTNKELSTLNMWHARRMVSAWNMPVWTTKAGRPEEKKAATQDIDKSECRQRSVLPPPPPTILLRAREMDGDKGSAFVDRTRDFRMLGWEEYNKTNGGFIRNVVDVEGSHFTVFGFDKIEDTSMHIRNAADQLEQWYHEKR